MDAHFGTHIYTSRLYRVAAPALAEHEELVDPFSPSGEGGRLERVLWGGLPWTRESLACSHEAHKTPQSSKKLRSALSGLLRAPLLEKPEETTCWIGDGAVHTLISS